MEKADLSKKSPVRLHYTNSKGKQVCIGITQHARKRFIERWGRIYPDTELDPATVDSKIAEFFAQTIRQKTYDRKHKTRLKRHGKDTLYFKHSHLTFIVQDAALLTVEISDRSKRYLNKQEHLPVRLAAYAPPQRCCNTSKACSGAPTDSQHNRKAIIEVEPKVQLIPQAFYLTGIVLLDDGTKLNVDIGKHEALTSAGDPALLIAKPEFADFVRERARCKCPDGYLDGVFISLGRKQHKTLFWRIEQRAR
ncbi:MAG TPA: hypothetical protein DDZ51_06210 [Planctomycetaceae bacterium]|nr:hypothetical protein [Planctomycetaceae bacterium]